MWRKRLLWLGLMLLAGGMYLFENRAATLAMLLCVVLLPLFSVLFALLSRHQIRAELVLDKTAMKHVPIGGKLRLTNRGLLPTSVYGYVSWHNLRTGETETREKAVFLWGKRTTEVPLSFTAAHCGKLHVQWWDMHLSDVFGLFTFPLTDSPEASVIVHPTQFAVELLLSSGGASMLDSDRYSQDKPGNDPGETFAIREYVPGDMVKHIHWKLSQKTDKLMVRELGLPIVQQVLLLVETSAMGQNAQVIDAVSEVAASLSWALLSSAQSYKLAWQIPQTGELVMRDVESETDLIDAWDAILSVASLNEGQTVTECFSREVPLCTYAHAVVVSPAAQSMIRNLYSGNRVTQFLPQHGGDGLQTDGTYLVSFDEENYARDMIRIEV